jgi:hypothetical protein
MHGLRFLDMVWQWPLPARTSRFLIDDVRVRSGVGE